MKNKIIKQKKGFILLIVVVMMSSFLMFSIYLTQYYIWNLSYAQSRFEKEAIKKINSKNCTSLNSLYVSFDSNFNLMNC
jgi:hypothetical protein